MEWSGWDAVLKVLRDPLTALFVGIFLALLAVGAVRSVVRWLFAVAAAGAFIWLLVTFEPVEAVTVAVISGGVQVLLIMACLAAIVIFAAIVAALVMRHRARNSPDGAWGVVQPQLLLRLVALTMTVV